MIKCEVLDTCNIVVGKGSIVEVSERQYELARKFLKPLNAKKEIKSEEPVKVEETTAKVEEVEVPKIEKRTKKKK